MSPSDDSRIIMPPVAVLAGGLATRLGSLTARTPKAMLEVAGHPFIYHQLRLLKRRGVHQVVLCVGHMGSLIEDYVGDGSQYGVRVTYSYDGAVLLGTGGAIRKALPKLSEIFLVMYGDSYLDTNYGQIVDYFHKSKKLGLMTVLKNDDKWDKSNVVYSDGSIRHYSKTATVPGMKHIDYGLSVFHSGVFDRWGHSQHFDLAEVHRFLTSMDELAGYEISERFYEIGSNEGLIETDFYLRKEV